jgi:hypothetical protein
MTNPNLPPSPNLLSGHIDGLSDALQIYSIESLRDQQSDTLTQALVQEEINLGRSLTDAEKDAIRNTEYAKYDTEVENYLKTHGIDSSHPNYAAYSDKLKQLSIDKVPPSDWNVSPIDPNDSSNFLPSPRDLAMNDLATNFAAPVVPTPSPIPPVPSVPPIPMSPPTSGSTAPTGANPAAQSPLDEARAKLAGITAKRQAGLNILNREKRKAEFRESQNDYARQLKDLVRDELQREIAAGNLADEADQRLHVAARLMDSYKALQEATNEAMENTKMTKFIRFMTSGGTVMRIIKGAGLGVVVGGVGLAVTAATGGASVVVGAATGATMASRLARGYAAFDAGAGRGVKVKEPDSAAKLEALQESGADNVSADFAINMLSVYLLNEQEKDTNDQIKKRRWSAGKAAALVVIGAGAVEGLRYGYDFASDYLNKSPSTGGGATQPEGTGGSTPSPEDSGSGTGDTHTEKPGGSGHPSEKPGGAAPEAPKSIEYNSDAMTISNGEGFYQTFQEMDIPQKDWAELLDKVGPELHDMQVDGHSLAYRMPNGEWGIRMTADGKMPEGALDAITKAHDQMTGHVTGGDVSGTEASPGGGGIESSTETTPDASTAKAPETAAVNPPDVSGIMNQTSISAADIEGNSAMEAITHVSPNFSPEGLGQRLNLPASEWLRLQEYIVAETQDGNKLYTTIFRVNENGYLRFTGNHIPAGTMADMLMHISPSVRYGLAA